MPPPAAAGAADADAAGHHFHLLLLAPLHQRCRSLQLPQGLPLALRALTFPGKGVMQG